MKLTQSADTGDDARSLHAKRCPATSRSPRHFQPPHRRGGGARQKTIFRHPQRERSTRKPAVKSMALPSARTSADNATPKIVSATSTSSSP